jgi:hypothetical protein
MKTGRWMTAIAALSTFACVTTLRSDDESPPNWQPYFHHLAESYQITPDSTPDEPLTLQETPVLRWNQPVRGGDDGAVYVWLRDGTPAMIGTMFCWPHPDGYRVVTNEFHSLLSEPMTAVRDGKVVWTPRDGITWNEFGRAPAPAATSVQRLIQMRQLANRFRGENLDDETGQTWPLRLLRQPLFRVDLSDQDTVSEDGVLDGALFALASGTDPEILLLIEARTTANGDGWRWALAGFSDRPLTAWLDGEEVWSVERAHPTQTTPHTILNVDQLVRPPQEEPQS